MMFGTVQLAGRMLTLENGKWRVTSDGSAQFPESDEELRARLERDYPYDSSPAFGSPPGAMLLEHVARVFGGRAEHPPGPSAGGNETPSAIY